MSKIKIFTLFIFLSGLVISFLPIFFQINSPKNGYQFNGSFHNMVDKPFYLTIMKQGESNFLKINNLYTTEIGSEQRLMIYPFYLFSGHLARLIGFSVEAVFLLERLILGLIFAFLLYRFSRFVIKSDLHHFFLIFLFFFSSGLGAFWPQSLSPDLFMPDWVAFNRWFSYPHILLANILVLLVFYFFWRIFIKNNLLNLYGLFLSIFLLGFVLPYYTVALVAVFLFFLVIFANNLFLRQKILFVFIAFLPLLFTKILIAGTLWEKINNLIFLSPPPVFWLLIGLGIPFLIAIFGFFRYLFSYKKEALFFLLWFLIPILLAYFPWFPNSFQQRRFLDLLLYIPIAVFASFFCIQIYFLLKNKKNLYPWLFFIFLMPLLSVSIIASFQYYSNVVKAVDIKDYYLKNDTLLAYEWIAKNTPKNSVILTQLYTGEYLPVYSFRRVYLGHVPATLDWKKKQQQSSDFYSAKMNFQEIILFLKDNKINYIFAGEEEKISVLTENFLNGYAKLVYNNEIKIWLITGG